MDYQPKPLPRSSTTLLDRYNSAASITSGGGDAKRAGNSAFASTDYVSTGDGEFKPMQGPAGIRNDTRSVILNTMNKHGGKDFLQTVKYAPSGRLP